MAALSGDIAGWPDAALESEGDIWSVAASGGDAVPLTLSESYEFAPVWSHDGKSVAFASDRYGSFDVFAMPGGGLGEHVEAAVPV